MQHHIKNCRKFGVKVVVAVNQFASDTEAELEFVKKAALEAGAFGFFFFFHLFIICYYYYYYYFIFSYFIVFFFF